MKKSYFISAFKLIGIISAIFIFFVVLAILRGTGYEESFKIKELNRFFNSKNITLNNNVTVVYFWATWCGVCKTQKPLIDNYYQRSKKSSLFNFISIEEGEDLNVLKKYIKVEKINFPILVANTSFLQKWNIEGFPTFIFLDKNNKVRFVDSGIITPISFYFRIFYLNFF